MQKSVRYLEFFESLLDPNQTVNEDDFKNTELPAILAEAFSLEEKSNRLQSEANADVYPLLEEIESDIELLDLARTPN